MKLSYRTGIIIFLLLASCNPDLTPAGNPPTQDGNDAVIETTSPSPPQPQLTSTPQHIPAPANLGPDGFPQGYNPLTGQHVADPSLLKIPALLVSISHFPSVARPQAGFSFAPFVYEFFITEGATRHLTVFYGEFPEPEIPLHGDCEIRGEPFIPTGDIIGNRVWHDKDQNGIQDPGEGGIGGICISLYDSNNHLLQQTTTDSNGYYAFNVEAGRYIIEFVKPSGLEFTQRNIGDENQDSDADRTTGQTDALDITSSPLLWDAGLFPSSNTIPSDDLPLAQVGPVRSGRLLYEHIGNFYQNSCLIYASADPDVLAQIPGCATVAHTDAGGGAMLAIERMKRIAEQNNEGNSPFNYASNLYADKPPTGGEPAHELHEYWARLNQSKWVYDAASQAWWRYSDKSNEATAGILYPQVDRLNGRQLIFENIIVLFAEHTVVTPTIVDVNLKVGEIGKAYLFRDGQVYDIRWSTRADEYEQTTGLRRPIQFQNLDGTPAALKPGHTWVVIFTLQSYLEDQSEGVWRARFIAPEDAK
jgi:hypothetical protein